MTLKKNRPDLKENQLAMLSIVLQEDYHEIKDFEIRNETQITLTEKTERGGQTISWEKQDKVAAMILEFLGKENIHRVQGAASLIDMIEGATEVYIEAYNAVQIKNGVVPTEEPEVEFMVVLDSDLSRFEIKMERMLNDGWEFAPEYIRPTHGTADSGYQTAMVRYNELEEDTEETEEPEMTTKWYYSVIQNESLSVFESEVENLLASGWEFAPGFSRPSNYNHGGSYTIPMMYMEEVEVGSEEEPTEPESKEDAVPATETIVAEVEETHTSRQVIEDPHPV